MTRCATVALALIAGFAQAVPAQEPPPRDPTNDRGFLIAKATTLPQGTGYVAALVPGTLGIAYGFTDRLTGHIGTVPWTFFGGAAVSFASVRYGVLRSDWAHVAVGGFGIAAFDQQEYEAAGWPYVTTTVESESDTYSATILVGVGSSTSVFESDFDGKILLQAGAEARVARDLKLIVETLYLGEGSEPLAGVGGRLFGRRGAVDVGFAFVLSDDYGLLPWAGVAWSF